MRIKICGFQDEQTAREAARLGADALGFVFAKSRRQVAPAQAARIAAAVGGAALRVGVFVDERLERVQEIASEVGLDFVQLHGDEPADYARQLGLPVIKAFPFSPAASAADLLAYPADFILLDSAGPARGGNGTAFDWSLLARQSFDRSRLLLAGGLRSETVAEAIRQVQPQAVDVSSGVETEGRKDAAKIQAFIESAKGAFA